MAVQAEISDAHPVQVMKGSGIPHSRDGAGEKRNAGAEAGQKSV